MKMNNGNQLNPMSPQFQPFMGQYNLNANMSTPIGLPIEHHPHHFGPQHHPTAHLHSQHQRFMKEFNFNINKKRMKEENSDDDEDNDDEDEEDIKLDDSVACSNMNNLSGSKTPTSSSRSRSTSPNNSKSFKRQRVHSNSNDLSPVKMPMMNHLSDPTASFFSHLQLPHSFAPHTSNLPTHPLFAPLHLNSYAALECTNKQTHQPISPYSSNHKNSCSTPSKQSIKKCDISNIESLIESKNCNTLAHGQAVDLKPTDPLISSINQMDPSHFKDFLAATSAQHQNGNLPPQLLWYFYALSAQQQQIQQQNVQNEPKSIKKESEESKSERLRMSQDDEYEQGREADQSNEQQVEHDKSFEAHDEYQIKQEEHEDELNESVNCRRRRSSGSAKRSLDESELNEELDEQTSPNQEEELSNLSAVSSSKKIKLNSECTTTD
jgi:hypothetical protein